MAVSSSKKYGMPYQGSKRRIADKVIDLLPRAPVLVDLFAGGCAVTHAALESGKFDRVIANDLSDAPGLFYYASKYGGIAPRWVSREEFFAKKDNDPFIKYVYSFKNDGRSYMYGRDVEPLKYAGHRAVVDGDCSYLPEFLREKVKRALANVVGVRERYARYKAAMRELARDVHACELYTPQAVERLAHLERLLRLERLQSPDRFVVLRRDYRDVRLPEGAVIYCDPPYESTAGYGVTFDHKAFYAWCRAIGKRYPLFISGYWMPPGFRCVAEFEVSALAGAKTNAQTRIEKIFTIS